jgi:hypothetical protein
MNEIKGDRLPPPIVVTRCSQTWAMLIKRVYEVDALACPSEVLSLMWQDIDWANDRIVIHSPKTEHHPGKECRTIPLFPELRLVLEECLELAPEGAVYVVDERMRASAQGKAGWRNCNLRTTFTKIVRRAGLTPWPRLLHNLRSNRQTELAERFPSHVVCSWLGNSEDIARKHYYQTTDDHFRQATSAHRALRPALQQPTAGRGNGLQQASVGEIVPRSHLSAKTKPCKDLRTLSMACAAHLSPYQQKTCGWGGIRTPGRLSPTAVFKTAALDHSATHPRPLESRAHCRLFRLHHACYRSPYARPYTRAAPAGKTLISRPKPTTPRKPREESSLSSVLADAGKGRSAAASAASAKPLTARS